MAPGTWLVLCLFGLELRAVPDYQRPRDCGKLCWEVGYKPITTVNAVACGRFTPAGVFIPEACPSRAPEAYVTRLRCEEENWRGAPPWTNY